MSETQICPVCGAECGEVYFRCPPGDTFNTEEFGDIVGCPECVGVDFHEPDCCPVCGAICSEFEDFYRSRITGKIVGCICCLSCWPVDDEDVASHFKNR